MRVLVLGGYGNFGARICRGLAADARIELVVAGRDLGRADAMAASIGASVRGVAIDADRAGLADGLRRQDIGLVVHTAGPFQEQGYHVAEAAATAGAHYIDLSDGRRFVCDFPSATHDAFEKADRTAICGASTVPALSSAVVEHLCDGWRRIDAIDICIAPAQTAPRGRATLAGVLSYCGEPVDVWTDGRWQEIPGWSGLQKLDFTRLRSRLGALCDIPDLEIFPARYGVTQRVMFRAALEVGLAQRVFALLSRLRSMRLLPRLDRFAGLLNRTASVLDFMGTALGGMVVRVGGLDGTGRPARRAWHIAADDDHGPEIPCMAAILLARRIACDRAALPAGAFTAAGLLKLADFEPEFARWGMVTDEVAEHGGDA
jgi:saccharopine dehydrogenase-like NADP-dependent oxidoreductase